MERVNALSGNAMRYAAAFVALWGTAAVAASFLPERTFARVTRVDRIVARMFGAAIAATAVVLVYAARDPSKSRSTAVRAAKFVGAVVSLRPAA